jgi:O-antigen/teichoic acid export membrane protein
LKNVVVDTKHPDVTDEVGILAKGAGITLFARLGARGMQLAVQILLARYLGPADFGLFTIGQIVFQMTTQFGSLGLPTGVIRFGVPAMQNGTQKLARVLQHVFLIGFISGLAFGVGIFLIAPWLATSVFKRVELIGVLRGFAIASSIYIWLGVTSAATQISKRMQYSALSLDLAPFLVNLILVVILIHVLGLSVQTAILAVIAGDIAGWGLSIYFIEHLYQPNSKIGLFSYSLIGQLLSFSLPNMFAGIMNLWLQGITILLLGYYVSTEKVGIFQAAEQISMLSAIVLLAFGLVFSPMIADLHATGEIDKLNELFRVSTKWGLYISLPLLLVIVCVPTQIMTVAYGSEYAGGASILMLLALAQLINTATGAVAQLLSMTDNQNQLFLFTGIAFIVCIVFNLWLIPIWGPLGAALALAATIVLLNLGLLLRVRNLLGLWPYDRRYLKSLVASVVTVPIIYWCSRIWPQASIINLITITLFSVTLFGGILFALGPEDSERTLFSSLYRKLLLRRIKM